ncbi:Flp pilus assembly protein TadD [Sphingomonas naasensis]|uniref:Tetratricopeptide repeat protein n=1 Tax=Sphingomonas naasensis TaxID=1344951 RepID=A0A4V3QVA3_9SPHN|nr:tetratricopeptide repeat protein [Sphingomonas naasensis]NIJ19955.1 Flp pilus assembly protein TadD [Sphingomonas naasensis]TGX37912.1 tetratricopeptide repeat protein [Sphingomonas naasensis]
MTSSRNRSRSARRKPILRRLIVLGGAIGAFALVLAAWFALVRGRPDPAAAEQAVERSGKLLEAHNASAARDQARVAVRADPGNAQAHLILAKALLALDDGAAAEPELRRALEAGYKPGQVAHLRAHALLLQGEAEKALAEVAKADPRARGYALRIRARALAALGKLPEAFAALDQAVRAAPRDADIQVDAGRLKLDAGDVLGAIRASEQAVKLDGGNTDALVLRGEMVRSQFGLIAALPWFEAALQRDPEDYGALIEYAATLGDAGRAVDSLNATRRALAARPGSPQALYLQAVIAARAGNTDLARSLIERAGPGLAQIPAALLLGGALDVESADYEQAMDKLRPVVANQPMNLAARKLLAVALLRTDSARNAIDLLRPVIERGDADSYALTLAARGYERIGDRAAAAQLLDRAAWPERGDAAAFSTDDSTAVLAADADQRPGDPAALVPLIRALIGQGDKAGALARAQDMARRHPGAPAAHLLVGDTLMTMHRFADAAAAYRSAADMRFDEPAMLRLIEALDRADRRADAATVLALFLSQNPVNAAALRVSGRWQLAAGDYDAAIDTLELLRTRTGDGDAALNADLAVAYTGAGEFETAAEFGEAAYALAPANPVTADAWGWALYRNGDAQGAVELLQKAVVLAPHHAGLRWHLAQIYADLGRKPEARQQAQAALADPRFGDRAAATALAAQS